MYELGAQFGDGRVSPGTNVLVVGPPLTGKQRIARSIVDRGIADGEAGVVLSTRDCAEQVRATYADGPGLLGVVDCVTSHIGGSATDTETVKYPSGPTDVRGIRQGLSELLDHFYRDHGIDRTRIVVDSVTTLLLYSNLRRTYEIESSITSRVECIGGVGIHVAESTAHDEETLSTLRGLFDGVIETDVDGSVEASLPEA
ncbi:RAD55 family ATPase [Halomicrobium urmianum]|uniref:RAD55 family ATPase n=1 Tax=Halomicrobium urmianum TaxID=1586233 RepID=UPI001CD9876C|nr:recombinase RecA [Halomicrobium urmianum]